MVELTDADHHSDAVADTGEAYSQFRGWMLSCLWCEFKSYGSTKREALQRLAENHYDHFNIRLR